MIPGALLPFVAGLFGACVGSFLNVCVYRLPQEDLSVTRPTWSFCPRCRQPIRWYDNLPILSWFILRGRCRSCGESFSLRYAMVEILTAALFVAVALEKSDGTLELLNLATVGFWAALFAALVVVTFIDIDHRIIPDDISVTGAALVPLAAIFLPGVPVEPLLPAAFADLPTRGWSSGALPVLVLVAIGVLTGVVGMVVFRRLSPAWDGSVRTWWDTRLAASATGLTVVAGAGFAVWDGWAQRPETERLIGSLLGMAVGAGVIYAVLRIGKWVFKKDAMGFGDVKLMALLGAVLGWKAVLLSFFLACLLGSIVGIGIKLVTRSSYMPFGPYLCGGAAILVLRKPWIDAGIDWYMSLFPQ